MAREVRAKRRGASDAGRERRNPRETKRDGEPELLRLAWVLRPARRSSPDHQSIVQPFVTLNVSGGQNAAAELR